MPAATEIHELLIRDFITRAVANVFKTMTGCEPQVAADPHTLRGPFRSNRPQIVGTVGFNGECDGLIYRNVEPIRSAVRTPFTSAAASTGSSRKS